MPKSKEHIWIIGASAGIGEALAKEYARQGHSVALSARNKAALDKVHDTLPQNDHLVIALDVADYQSVTRAQNEVLQSWGRIDRIIFMAGIYQPMQMGELDLAATQNILHVNLLGAFHIAEAALRALPQTSLRQLAFCASVAGYCGLPNSQPYGASKAGLINMVESLRAEHGKHIDIKVINPGFVESRLTDKNDFHMPARISAQQAATYISRGLRGRAFEVHFPKRFTLILKTLNALPYWIYFRIMR